MKYKSPQEFYDRWIGKSVDVDGYYGAQCWDGFAKYCVDEGVKCSTRCKLTNLAGDLYVLRYTYGYDRYFEFFYPKHAQRGDWIFWSGHVAMVWNVDLANNRVQVLGQNHDGRKWFTLKWYKLSTALGCMRWKGWITAVNGWKKEYGNWYLYKDNKKLTGWQKAGWSEGESWFYFNKEGIMQTGWQYLGWDGGKKKDWFYFDKKSGAMLTGLRTLPDKGGEHTYYLDPQTGAMQTGVITMTLTFNGSGALIGGTKA